MIIGKTEDRIIGKKIGKIGRIIHGTVRMIRETIIYRIIGRIENTITGRVTGRIDGRVIGRI